MTFTSNQMTINKYSLEVFRNGVLEISIVCDDPRNPIQFQLTFTDFIGKGIRIGSGNH